MAVRTQFAAASDGGRIKTNQFKLGTSSLFVPNATSNAVLVLRNSDTSPGSTYTVEAFVRVSTFNANENTLWAPSSTGTGCVITLTSTSVKVYDQTGAAAKVLRLTASATLSTLTWYHVAVTYNGTTVTVYLDGVSIGSASIVGNMSISSAAYFIGRANTISSDSFFGYIDEFRLSSTVRYTGTFTPTTVAFTDDADTKMLFHFNNSDQATSILDDDGTDLETRTRYGAGFTTTLTQNTVAATTTTSYKKYGSKSYSFNGNIGGAAGNNPRVRFVQTYSNDLQGTTATSQPFIVEFWFKQTRGGAAADTGIFGDNTDGTTGNNNFYFRNTNGAYVFTIAGTLLSTGENNTTNFNHVCIEFKPSVGVQCYYNGVKVGAVQSVSSFTIANYYLGALQGVNSTYTAGSEIYIDDFRVTKGLQRYNHTAFTPPASLVNDEYTILLLKAEETTPFVDVVTLPPQTHSGAATLSSAFTSTQAGRLTKLGAFNKTASFSLEAQSRLLVKGASLEFGNFTLTAAASTLLKASTNLNAYFNLVGNSKVTRNGSATLSSAFTQTGAGRLLKLGQSSLTTTATLSVTPKVTHKAAAQLSSAFALTAQPDGNIFGLSTLSSAFTQSATAKVTHKAALTLSSAFTLTAQGKRSVKGASLEFGTFTLSVTPKVTHKATVNVTGTFTLTATAKAQPRGQASITAQFALTSTAKVTHKASLSLSSLFDIQTFYVGQRNGDFIIVPSESRIFDVAYETRTVQVDNEIRKMLVNKENRERLVASETRTLVV